VDGDDTKISKLWSKDFSLITEATISSAIGGEAMNLPISHLVFDQTKSTMMSAIIMVCGMLPVVILPVFIAPLIDKGSKRKWIVGLFTLCAMFIFIWIPGKDNRPVYEAVREETIADGTAKASI